MSFVVECKGIGPAKIGLFLLAIVIRGFLLKRVGVL